MINKEFEKLWEMFSERYVGNKIDYLKWFELGVEYGESINRVVQTIDTVDNGSSVINYIYKYER